MEYQYVGDTEAPLIQVTDSKEGLKDASFCEIEPTHSIFSATWNTKNFYQKISS